jgi:hypothetical protein
MHITKMEKIHSLHEKWLPVSIAPLDADLELCVIDSRGLHALVFPCRKCGNGWRDALRNQRVDVEPSHWRLWRERL